MSFDAMKWAIRQRLEPLTRVVLVALADKADKQARAFPSVGWLAEFCGCSRSTVVRELKRLRRMGLIDDSGDRVGLTSQVRVWQLRVAEDSLPLGQSRRRKGVTVQDALNGLKQFQAAEHLSGSQKGVRRERVSRVKQFQKTDSKAVTGDTHNQYESHRGAGAPTPANAGAPARQQLTFEVAADWQPPVLPERSKVRSFVEHWTADELGRQVERFRRKAKRDGVGPDLNAAWAAHVWQVELEGGV